MGSKIIKQIVSPESMRALDHHEQSVAEQKDLLLNDIADRKSYVAPDGDIDITKPGAQRGRPILASDMMKRLTRLNPNIKFKASTNPDILGIYYITNQPDPMTGKSPWCRHICGMPSGEISEFHQPLIVTEKIPDPNNGLNVIDGQTLEGHIPGWRAILLSLIKEDIIFPYQAEAEFKVSQGRSSKRWQQQAVN